MADAAAEFDPQDASMQSTAVSSTARATVDGLPILLGRATLCVGVLGVGLGIWCRAFVA